jgi:hypothetical protein
LLYWAERTSARLSGAEILELGRSCVVESRVDIAKAPAVVVKEVDSISLG